VTGETERLIEMAGELSRRVNRALGDVIPAEAQRHLLTAQKELLTALFLIYEHQVGERGSVPQGPAARPSGTRSSAPAARPGTTRPRVQRIDIQ
jgi:hypothetical protein